MAQAAAQRVGYANGGPVEAPADDDTVYPTTAPKWDELSPEAAMMGASVGYARGGTVQSNDINKRAALLAGLRKRYDAMIAMAQGAHAHGDIKTAAHLASKAHDMVPDGKNLTHNVTPDGHILSVVHGRGGVQSTHPMTSQQFHHYLVGPATSFDHVIDNGVGHNLHIASGRQQPRVQEHPNDPIHRVRQVLQHTRQAFGLHRIGQRPPTPRVGYAAGGTVDDDNDPTQMFAFSAPPEEPTNDQPRTYSSWADVPSYTPQRSTDYTGAHIGPEGNTVNARGEAVNLGSAGAPNYTLTDGQLAWTGDNVPSQAAAPRRAIQSDEGQTQDRDQLYNSPNPVPPWQRQWSDREEALRLQWVRQQQQQSEGMMNKAESGLRGLMGRLGGGKVGFARGGPVTGYGVGG